MPDRQIVLQSNEIRYDHCHQTSLPRHLKLPLSTIDRQTLRERALAELRAAIVDGRFAPGERLVERTLCEALGISRGSLREVLRSLETEGLVVTVAHRGPSVATISEAQAREIYAVREMLEGLAARQLAEARKPQAVARLQAELDRLRACRRQSAALGEIKDAFYRALFEGAGNATLAAIMATLLARISLLRRASFSRPERLAQSITEITALVDAIRAGDADAAERASREHVRRARDAALQTLSDPPTRSKR